MKYVAPLFIFGWAVACQTTVADRETDDPDCQIRSEGERSPGYPFDLGVFSERILPVISADCSSGGCHGPPAGAGEFTVWAAAAPGNCDFARTFNAVAEGADLANPTNSRLYVAVSGASPSHPVNSVRPREAAKTVKAAPGPNAKRARIRSGVARSRTRRPAIPPNLMKL